jgi:hypothetical protein
MGKKMNEEDIENAIIDKLILEGGLEVGGIDIESGEILYTFTNKLKEIMPELYNEHLNFVNSEIMYFWERGFLDIDDLLEDNPKVTINEKALNQEEIDKLPKERQKSLDEIKRILKVV